MNIQLSKTKPTEEGIYIFAEEGNQGEVVEITECAGHFYALNSHWKQPFCIDDLDGSWSQSITIDQEE